MATRWGRFGRGWLAAIFATLIAAVSHTAAGGMAPNALSIGVALAFSGVVCVLLTARTLSLLRSTVAVVISQLAFHILFSILAAAPVGSASSGGAHLHGATPLLTSTFSSGSGDAHHTDPWMWFAHAGAALLTIAILRRGEAAFWGMRAAALRFLRTVFVSIPRVPVAITTATTTPTPARVVSPRIFVLLLGSLQHRGPPAMALA
ncbi:MAG: hypothetical protein ACOH1T_04420 [Microbacteriaceae bacterium]